MKPRSGPPAAGRLELVGTIDRMDELQQGQPTRWSIDYKTESDSVTRAAHPERRGRHAACLLRRTAAPRPRCAPPTSTWASAARRNCTNRTRWRTCDVLIEGISARHGPHRRRAPRCPRWARAVLRVLRRARPVPQRLLGRCRQGASARDAMTESHPRPSRPPTNTTAARLARGLLRHCLRPRPQRGGGGLRGRGQDLDAGLAHAARAAGRLRAA